MIAISCAFILTFAAAFHFYWGFGGRVGSGVALPQREDGQLVFKPRANGAHIIGLALVVSIVFILSYAGFFSLPFPYSFVRIVVFFLAVVFTVRALARIFHQKSIGISFKPL